jgi:UDP:flavonoid glycosyltransferase YjiC (YdhE family)
MGAEGRVLVCVLDWGLGHASRTSVLLQDLQDLGYTPVVASFGAALFWLKKTFPELRCIEKPGYKVSYSTKTPFFLDLLLQSPKLFHSISAEKEWLDNIVRQEQFDAVISDNCYGCYHSSIPSFILTHQVNLPLQGFAGKLAQKEVDKALRNFDAILVPDHEGDHNYSGKLGQFKEGRGHYIGALSRFEHAVPLQPEKKEVDICAIISGPDPDRLNLEKTVYSTLMEIPGKHLLFCGHEKCKAPSTENITCFSLNDEALSAEHLQRSRLILSRSGYSSLMDYAPFQIPALLVPCKGQAEQEYLAQLWHERYAYVTLDDLTQLKSTLLEVLSTPKQPFQLPKTISMPERRQILKQLLG